MRDFGRKAINGEEPENLVLELLRGMRSDLGRVENRLDRIEKHIQLEKV